MHGTNLARTSTSLRSGLLCSCERRGRSRFMGHFDVRVSPTDRLREITVMKRGPLTPGMSPHQMGVLLATCALHAIGIYYVATQAVTGRGSLWSTLEVSFIPITKQEPPPPPIIPVLLTDAFAEHLLSRHPGSNSGSGSSGGSKHRHPRSRSRSASAARSGSARGGRLWSVDQATGYFRASLAGSLPQKFHSSQGVRPNGRADLHLVNWRGG